MPRRGPLPPLAVPGDPCVSDRNGIPHVIGDPAQDTDLLTVHAWLTAQPLHRILTIAVNDAVEYVLDGARTWRFDLDSPDVDSDERATVGTKLQYRLLDGLNLVKLPPLDTVIQSIPVEIKGTVRKTWMIPREGQCEICILVQVDTANEQHRAWLMRTHRAWLNNGKNGDKKRSIRADAHRTYALPLIGWTPLPTNPLKLLTPAQVAVVFDLKRGQERRLTDLFGFLPDTVIPRSSILTVCANRDDPMRRAREIKTEVAARHGLKVLCGTWVADIAEAKMYGYDITGRAWIALTPKPSPQTPTGPSATSGNSGQHLLGNGTGQPGGDGVPDLLSDLGFGADPEVVLGEVLDE